MKVRLRANGRDAVNVHYIDGDKTGPLIPKEEPEYILAVEAIQSQQRGDQLNDAAVVALMSNLIDYLDIDV